MKLKSNIKTKLLQMSFRITSVNLVLASILLTVGSAMAAPQEPPTSKKKIAPSAAQQGEGTKAEPGESGSSEAVSGISKMNEILFEEDFESGMERWELVDPESWKLEDHGLGKSLSIIQRESKYEPEYRSPKHIALIKELTAASFELTFKVKSTKNTGNHRDCCVFFNYQDPSHYYYVHLGAKPDPRSGQIMIVDGAPRLALTENENLTPWSESDWHNVKLVRDSEQGTIKIYFDDMEKPHMQVDENRFSKAGRIGLGSFDDMDAFDQVQIRSLKPSVKK
jgi:hypothetical protein